MSTQPLVIKKRKWQYIDNICRMKDRRTTKQGLSWEVVLQKKKGKTPRNPGENSLERDSMDGLIEVALSKIQSGDNFSPQMRPRESDMVRDLLLLLSRLKGYYSQWQALG